MKRRITSNQLQELTDEQKQKLRERWKPESGDWFYGTYGNDESGFKTTPDEYGEHILTPYYTDCGHYGAGLNPDDCFCRPDSNALPLLSVSQMIELLQEKHPVMEIERRLGIEYGWNIEHYRAFELADVLWIMVKEVLADD
jgi:hypothetical protein